MVAFNRTPETCLGILEVEVKNKHYKSLVEVNIVSRVTDKLLLSLKACKALGYVHEDFPAVIKPNKMDEPGIWSTTPEFKCRQVCS